MDEKINILCHCVFYFFNIQQRMFHLFCNRPPDCAWFNFHSTPHCRPVCGGNSWHYWHQSWMHFTTNCLCKTFIYIMVHSVCRYPYCIELELNKVKTIPTPGTLYCGWPPALASLAAETINKVSHIIISLDIPHLYTFILTFHQYQECHLYGIWMTEALQVRISPCIFTG